MGLNSVHSCSFYILLLVDFLNYFYGDKLHSIMFTVSANSPVQSSGVTYIHVVHPMFPSFLKGDAVVIDLRPSFLFLKILFI